MWKNVFIESCILSALIFGGFYFNASYLKKAISDTEETFLNESKDKSLWTHVSGGDTAIQVPKKKLRTHLSGSSTDDTPVPPISGANQPPLPRTK